MKIIKMVICRNTAR